MTKATENKTAVLVTVFLMNPLERDEVTNEYHDRETGWLSSLEVVM